MSDDWKVGDLALCVNDKPCHCGCDLHPLKGGHVYRVCALVHDDRLGTGLHLDGVPLGYPHTAYGQSRFRKIRPDEHEDCEPEFVTLLNNCKPVKVQA